MNETLQKESGTQPQQTNSTATGKMLPVLSVLALVLCSLALPLCHYTWGAPLVLALLFAYTVVAMRRPGPTFALLLPALLATALSYGSLVPAALTMALIIGVGILAYLYATWKYAWIAFLIPILTLPIGYLLMGWNLLIATPLFLLPAGWLLGFAVERKTQRTRSILYAMAGLLMAAFLLAYLILQSISVEAGKSIVDFLHDGMGGLLIRFRDQLYDAFRALPGMDPAVLKDTFAPLTDAVMGELASQIVMLLPAVLCVVTSVIAYEAQYLVLGLCFYTDKKELLTPETRTFTMSVPAAAIFMIATVLTLFLPFSLFQSVVVSLSVILTPGFLLLGVAGVVSSLRRLKGGSRTAMLLFFAALLCCMSSNILIFLALYGAYGRMMSAAEKKLYQHLSANKDDPDNGNNDRQD